MSLRELLVVDDGSTDGTRDILRGYAGRPGVRVVFHERNLGKGAAVRTGLKLATGTFTATMDADLEYEPSELGALLEPLLREDADAVFGVRGFEGRCPGRRRTSTAIRE